MERYKKIIAILAWLITGLTFIVVVLPSVLKLVMITWDTNNKFIGFQLKDETGQMHVGFAILGYVFDDVELAVYGYQTPAGTDVSKWHVPYDEAKQIDGFEWGDKGFLWHTYKPKGADVKLKTGTRLGLEHPIRIRDETELTLPGAPWDMNSQDLSFFGKFPNYEVKFDNGNIAYDFKLTALTPAWYMYNEGRPLRSGDFSTLSMNELPCRVNGVITHQKTGKSFRVTGKALMEEVVGIPWNTTLSYGTHDWTNYYFPGGWNGSLWKARDDWQWGYHRSPNTGWIWDPEMKEFITFYRIEIVEADYVIDEVSGSEYPRHMLWRAIGPNGTLEVETKNVSMYPNKIPVGVVTFEMVYGPMVSKGRLLRRDGTVVELGTGESFMEYYPAIIPDIAFWGPLMLVLLVMIWSAYAFIVRKIEDRSILPPIGWCATGLFAVLVLNLAWSI